MNGVAGVVVGSRWWGGCSARAGVVARKGRGRGGRPRGGARPLGGARRGAVGSGAAPDRAGGEAGVEVRGPDLYNNNLCKK